MGLLPTLRYKRVNEIPKEKLKEHNISLILLDMDNTTAPWRTDYVAPEIACWVSYDTGLVTASPNGVTGITPDRWYELYGNGEFD